MPPVLPLVILTAATVALAVGAAALVYRTRITPAERERRRRSLILRQGRMTDGMLTDVSDDTLYYTYVVHGVEYAAAQEVGPFRDKLPGDLVSLIGSVTVRFSPRNPANSIVVSEEWTGLRPGNGRRTASRESIGGVIQ